MIKNPVTLITVGVYIGRTSPQIGTSTDQPHPLESTGTIITPQLDISDGVVSATWRLEIVNTIIE